MTSSKTPLFLQEQIQVIPDPFCFNHKEYFYTEYVGKRRSCLQGSLGWSLFGELPHPKGMEHMAGFTICRATKPGRARAHHPGRRLQLASRLAKSPRSWAARAGRGCLAESCRDNRHWKWEVAESSSLKVFKRHIEMALSDIV